MRCILWAQQTKGDKVKTLMFAGMMTSSLIPTVAESAHVATKRFGHIDQFPHEMNLIDPTHMLINNPRYVLSSIDIEGAEYFEHEGTSYGEVDRCAIYKAYPMWYHEHASLDPEEFYENNPNNEPVERITFSKSIKHLRWKNINNVFVIPNESKQNATKIKFTFKDVLTLEEQDITMYFNGGWKHGGIDQVFLGLMPGVKKIVNANNVTVDALNVMADKNDNDIVPSLFGIPITLYDSIGHTGIYGHSSHLTKLNKYMAVGTGGHDGHWGSYVHDLLDGFKNKYNNFDSSHVHYVWPDKNFIQGMNLLYRAPYNLMVGIYGKLNHHTLTSSNIHW